MSIFFTLAILSSLAGFPSCFSVDQQYEQCRSHLTCRSASKIFPNTTYPFWGDSIGRPDFCGRTEFKLSCEDDNQNLTLKIDDRTVQVRSSNLTNKSIIVADESLLQGNCPKFFDFKGNYHFTNSPNTETIDLYECNTPPSTPHSTYTCNDDGDYKRYHFFQSYSSSTHNCFKTGEIPVLGFAKKNLSLLFQSNQELRKALQLGFELRYTIRDPFCQDCTNSTGICGSKPGSQDFRCLCEDKPHKISCNITDKDKINWKVKSAIGVVAGFFGIAGACIVCYVCYRRKIKIYRTSSALLPRNLSSEPSSKSSDVEKADELLVGVQLFSYEELEEATNNFDPSKELGDGGFGTVYYGKLKDGRSVAVKRLYDNNFKRASQFRNEVEILTGLRHPNLVALFGCSSKQSRDLLLVYEYVANGTLADHLHGPQANPSTLPWSIRLKIAVETASALKYLHASDIIHRDVKSNNILLDQNFNVKVADFGLSRLFPMGQTHVSTAPQGTPGYVDPDYHLCYQLSNKSDVYSFAVVLMELISSLPAVDISRPRHEINLSSMAVIKIQSHELHAMVDPLLGFDTDTKVRQSVTAVAELAFQCLQSDKDLRPCMSHVLETLTRIQNNGFGSQMDVTDVNKSGPLQSPDSVMVKWDSK